VTAFERTLVVFAFHHEISKFVLSVEQELMRISYGNADNIP
jgi:hypothetical protein